MGRVQTVQLEFIFEKKKIIMKNVLVMFCLLASPWFAVQYKTPWDPVCRENTVTEKTVSL